MNSKGNTVNFDAHHIVENKYGGPNEWWTLQPARGGKGMQNQHQGGMHKTDLSKNLFSDG